MTSTLNDRDIISGSIFEPSVGVWHAELEVDSAESITGAVTIKIDDTKFVGTVQRGGIDGGRFSCRVVGGNLKLAQRLEAKSYISCPLSIPLSDVMTESGETLDAASDSLLSNVVPAWTRSRDTAGNALNSIVSFAGKVWRITRAGTVIVTDQSYPVAAAEFVTISNDHAEAVLTIANETSGLVAPATTVSGFAISYVATHINAGSTRQHLYYV